MARLRPARTVRDIHSQAWARYSQKKPKKNYIRALPHTSLLVFNMGKIDPSYDVKVTLNTTYPIQLRSNALEAARQIVNKYMETHAPNGYSFKILVYPHNVIREHRMATGAGADRISQGMMNAFGKPIGLAARLIRDQPIFMIKTKKANLPFVDEAFRRARSKLSGKYKVLKSEINEQAENKAEVS